MLCLGMTYSVDLRKTVMSFLSDGGSKSEAVRTFKISRDTIYRWLNAEDLRPKKHGSRHRKIDMEALRRHVEADSDMFLHDRAKAFNVSTSAMHYAMKRLGFVKKRTRL